MTETTPPKPLVLLVEDVDDSRAIMRMLLEMEGYRVLEASNGLEAVDVAARHYSEIGLILMDLTMPVMDGYEATRLLLSKEETNRIPVLALSAHCDQGPHDKALAAGCRECLGKPVDVNTLIETIRRYTSQPPGPPGAAK